MTSDLDILPVPPAMPSPRATGSLTRPLDIDGATRIASAQRAPAGQEGGARSSPSLKRSKLAYRACSMPAGALCATTTTKHTNRRDHPKSPSKPTWPKPTLASMPLWRKFWKARTRSAKAPPYPSKGSGRGLRLPGMLVTQLPAISLILHGYGRASDPSLARTGHNNTTPHCGLAINPAALSPQPTPAWHRALH